MLQFVRRVVAALLKRLRPFGPPEDPYSGVRYHTGQISLLKKALERETLG
jgi:hypothetical protein